MAIQFGTTISSAQYFPARQYMTTDGMPSNTVYDIGQESSGMMWFITARGPVRYNAKKWITFEDQVTLPTHANSRLTITPDDRIWVAGLSDSAFTVASFKNDNWSYEPTPPFAELIGNRHFVFSYLTSQDKGKLAFAKDDTLFILQRQTNMWEKLTLAKGEHIYNIVLTGDSLQWITTSKGLYTLSNNTLSPYPIPHKELPNPEILNLTWKDSTYYLLGYNWVASMKNDQLTIISEEIGLYKFARMAKTSIVVDQDNRLFVGLNTPALMYNPAKKEWEILTIDGEILNIRSNRIYCDLENNIWVGDSRGLFKFNILQFKNWNKKTGLGENEVSSLLETSDGSIILASPRTLNIWKDNHIQTYQIGSYKEPDFRVLDMEEDPAEGLVYIATSKGGLLIFKLGEYYQPIKKINHDSFGFVSIEKFNGSIYAANPTSIFKFDGLDYEKVGAFDFIRNLKVVNDKLVVLSGSQGIRIYTDDGLFHDYVSDSYNLRNTYHATMYKGDLLIATISGIGVIEGDNIVKWDKLQNHVPTYSLLVDSKGILWMGTDQGVFLYDDQHIKNYSYAEGLSGNEINRNALIEDHEFNIWIGTEKGASTFNIFQNDISIYAPEVELLTISSGQGRKLENGKRNTLPYHDNTITITYQCLSYIKEEMLTFRYRLTNPDEDSDTEWINIPNLTSNEIRFSNLRYGDYKFEIQARIGDENWGEISGFELKIEEPVFAKWWFILLVILLIIISIIATFRIRYILLIKKQKHLRNLVEERTKEIRKLNAHLEEKVEERTKKLQQRNIQLADYAFINAHYLRGPLTKIKSLIHVVDLEPEQGLDRNMINILKESADELDSVIHTIKDTLGEQQSEESEERKV